MLHFLLFQLHQEILPGSSRAFQPRRRKTWKIWRFFFLYSFKKVGRRFFILCLMYVKSSEISNIKMFIYCLVILKFKYCEKVTKLWSKLCGFDYWVAYFVMSKSWWKLTKLLWTSQETGTLQNFNMNLWRHCFSQCTVKSVS
jgi:hypothetical protein